MAVRISILVPVYGVEKYIERCVRSIMEHDYPSMEVIFVDDRSPDGSMEVLRKVLADYPQRDVKVLTHSTNRGVAASRNTLLDAATGDRIMFCDSDDWLAPGAVTRFAQAATADIVVCDHVEVYADFQSVRRVEVADDYLHSVLHRRTRGTLWGVLARATLWEGIRAVEGLDYGEDLLLYAQLVARADSVAKVDEPLYYYNLTNRSSISASLSPDKARQMVAIAEILHDIFKDDGLLVHTKIALLQSGNRATWRYTRRLYRGLRAPFFSLVLLLARLDLWFLMPLYHCAHLLNRLSK